MAAEGRREREVRSPRGNAHVAPREQRSAAIRRTSRGHDATVRRSGASRRLRVLGRAGRPALRLVAAPAGATPSPALSPEAKARLIALPDPLRAWAREEPVVRLHLTRHVLHGESLRDCPVSLASDLGPEGVSAVGERLREGELNTLAATFAVQLVRRRPW